MTEANQHSGMTRPVPAVISRILPPIFLAFLVAFPAGGLRADLVGNTRPQATPRTITVYRGQSVEVPLGVATESTKQVEFRIATPPEHGQLGTIVYVERDTRNGAVAYRPPEDPEITEDVFFYKARIPDLVVSEAVPVRVKIIDPVARLVMEQGLAFGRVLVGEEAMDRLQIINEGNGTYDAVLSVPPPWFIPEAATHVVVKPNEVVLVPVFFRPTERGAKSYRFVLQPDHETGSVDFFGEGYSPISASPSSAELLWDGENKRRSARIKVTNATDEALLVTVVGDERLQVGEAFEVAAKAVVDFEPWLPADDMGEYEGTVALEADGYREIIDVRASVMPAVIQIVEPAEGVVRFAHHAGEASGVQTVKVRNAGGTEVFLYGEIVDPYRIAEGSDSVALEPGKELEFHLTVDTGRIGQYDRDFAIIGGPETLRVPVLGLIAAEGTTLPEIYANDPARTGASGATTKQPAKPKVGSGEVAPWAMELYLRSVGIDAEERKYSDAVPQLEQVFLKERTKKRLDIWWKHPPKKGEWTYVVEARWLDVDPAKGFPKPVWYPLTGVEFKEDLDGVTAVLDGLKPGQEYILRVLAKDKNGLYGEPTPTFTFGTVVPEPSTWWKWLLGIGIPAGLGGGYWYWRKRQLEES
jgi:hypothetical protein